MKPDIGSESRFLPTPPAFDASIREGGPHRNIGMTFSTEKLEWCRYPMVKKIEDMITRFDSNHERRRQTDRRTDRHTDTAWRHKPR